MIDACLTQRFDHAVAARRKVVGASGDDLPQVVVVERNQCQQLLMLVRGEVRAPAIEQTGQDDVVLKKAAPAAPAQF